MLEFHDFPDLVPDFVGREKELNWLRDAVLRRRKSFTPIVVSGSVGVGKTALLKQFLATTRMTYSPSWLDLYAFDKPDEAIASFVERMLQVRERIVVAGNQQSGAALRH